MALNAALGYETDLMIFMIFAHSCFLLSRWILKNNGFKMVLLPFAVTEEPLDSDIFLWNPSMYLRFKNTLKNKNGFQNGFSQQCHRRTIVGSPKKLSVSSS